MFEKLCEKNGGSIKVKDFVELITGIHGLRVLVLYQLYITAKFIHKVFFIYSDWSLYTISLSFLMMLALIISTIYVFGETKIVNNILNFKIIKCKKE